jgi:hypothetical protein
VPGIAGINTHEPSTQRRKAKGWFDMQAATHRSPEVRQAATGPIFVSLDLETRSAVDTATAAFHLSRQPQTLRAWACLENGPLRPVRMHGRLAWKTEDLRRVLGVKT